MNKSTTTTISKQEFFVRLLDSMDQDPIDYGNGSWKSKGPRTIDPLLARVVPVSDDFAKVDRPRTSRRTRNKSRKLSPERAAEIRKLMEPFRRALLGKLRQSEAEEAMRGATRTSAIRRAINHDRQRTNPK